MANGGSFTCCASLFAADLQEDADSHNKELVYPEAHSPDGSLFAQTEAPVPVEGAIPPPTLNLGSDPSDWESSDVSRPRTICWWLLL